MTRAAASGRMETPSNKRIAGATRSLLLQWRGDGVLLAMLICPRMPTTQLSSSLANRRHNGAMVVGWTKKKMDGGSKRCLSVVERLTQPAPRCRVVLPRRYVPPHHILTFVPRQINDEPIEYLSRCRLGGVTLCRSACSCVRSKVGGTSYHRVGTK